jgi:hypothetical protein
MSPRCSVVLPAYNEEGAIGEAIAEIRTHVLAIVPDKLVPHSLWREARALILDEPNKSPCRQNNLLSATFA